MQALLLREDEATRHWLMHPTWMASLRIKRHKRSHAQKCDGTRKELHPSLLVPRDTPRRLLDPSTIHDREGANATYCGTRCLYLSYTSVSVQSSARVPEAT